MNPTTYTQANKIPAGWPREYVDVAQAEQVSERYRQPRPNKLERHIFDMPELGTWKLDWIGNTGEFSVLVEVPVLAMEASEKEWSYALQYESTRKYIEWQREGYEPPPPTVITTVKGNLRCMNRRRWLAAREAGVKSLKCWYSPSLGFGPKWTIEKE